MRQTDGPHRAVTKRRAWEGLSRGPGQPASARAGEEVVWAAQKEMVSGPNRAFAAQLGSFPIFFCFYFLFSFIFLSHFLFILLIPNFRIHILVANLFLELNIPISHTNMVINLLICSFYTM
jgi:hypothetical protein